MSNKTKSTLKALLKRYRILYHIYFIMMSILINILKLFIKKDNHLILFVSFGGRRCADSPKAIYEFMQKDCRFSTYRLVWGFTNPSFFPEIEFKVKIDTLKYFITSLKARCWITNVNIERGVKFKGKHTFSLYTGHGSPIKKCGTDVNKDNVFTSVAKSSFDACLAQSNFEKVIRSRIFSISQNQVYLTGAPTNDILACYDESLRTNIRKKLGVKDDKKAILFAPTFREYSHLGATDMPDVDFDKWHQLLGNNFVILYRAHPSSESTSLKDKSWFFDVTEYEDIEPLMIASDILVSDYSGLITDYSIMHKPIYLWTYDYEQYNKTRGLYFDIRKVLPYAEREEDLIAMIKEGFTQEQKNMVYKFQQEYATKYGSATHDVVNLIFNKITIQ